MYWLLKKNNSVLDHLRLSLRIGASKTGFNIMPLPECILPCVCVCVCVCVCSILLLMEPYRHYQYPKRTYVRHNIYILVVRYITIFFFSFQSDLLLTPNLHYSLDLAPIDYRLFPHSRPKINGRVAHLRLIVLGKSMVTILKTERYGYGSRHSLHNLWSLYPLVTWYWIQL